MKTVGLGALALLLTLVAAPALAGPQVPADTNAETASAAPRAEPERRDTSSMETGDPDREVCKKITYTGSRLGGERVCKTAREWGDLQRQSRQDTERKQRPNWRDE